MDKRLLFVLLIIIGTLVGCVEVGVPAATPVVTSVPVYLDDCLPPVERVANILTNPCFMGIWEYTYESHRWELPLQYRPIYQGSIGGESPAKVTINDREITFDLTYFAGYVALGFQVQLEAGQSYVLALHGESTLRIDNWQEASVNFSAQGGMGVDGVYTPLHQYSLGVPNVSPYGVPYYQMTGERTYTWGIFADTDILVDFEVGVRSNWPSAQHGSAFIAKSLSLVPTVWSGPPGDLIVVRH